MQHLRRCICSARLNDNGHWPLRVGQHCVDATGTRTSVCPTLGECVQTRLESARPRVCPRAVLKRADSRVRLAFRVTSVKRAGGGVHFLPCNKKKHAFENRALALKVTQENRSVRSITSAI